jgi:hypothetical protein
MGDKLFSQGEPAYGACLSRHPGERLYQLIEGYKLAADLLVEQGEDEAWRRRKLVYPIVFCYRHFLELTLKAMLDEYGEMANISPNWSHHRLENLWNDFRALLRNLGSDQPEDDGTEAVERCIAEFAKIDPSSLTFRYPIDKKGQSFDVDHEMIDLLLLRDTIQAIENYFVGCDGFLNEMKGAQPGW